MQAKKITEEKIPGCVEGFKAACSLLAEGRLDVGQMVATKRARGELIYWRVVDNNMRTRAGSRAAALQTDRIVDYAVFDTPTRANRMGQAEYSESSVCQLLSMYLLADIGDLQLVEPRRIEKEYCRLWPLSREEAGLVRSKKTFAWYRESEAGLLETIRRRQKTDLVGEPASWWLRTKADTGEWLIDEVSIMGELTAFGCNCCSGLAPACIIKA